MAENVVRSTRIGFIVPFDFALDREYWSYIPDSVSIHVTRTAYVHGPVSTQLAESVAADEEIIRATQSLLAIAPRLVTYACTSGSFVNGAGGEERIRRAIQAAGAPAALTTSGAMLEAMQHIGATRVAIATPYDRELTESLRSFLEEAHIAVTSAANLDRERDIFEIDAPEIVRLAEAADHPDAEALFLSCTNLPTIRLIPLLERRLRKPVLSANQVTMWAVLRRMDVTGPDLGHALFGAQLRGQDAIAQTQTIRT